MKKRSITNPVRTKPWREPNALGSEERKAVMRVMRRGRISLFMGAYRPTAPYSFLGGPEIRALEQMAAATIGVKHVVSINSATSGLMAAVGALGLGYGDEVIVSPYTMSASAVAPLWYGAIPVFADIEEDTGCLNPASILKRITPRTKAIIVVHQFGIPADMLTIMEIAKKHKLRVIEDCAQAWGATFKKNSVGTIGDIGIFSFNVHKTIQCGEGGLCVTKDDELALRLQMIRNHGEAVTEDAGMSYIINMVGGNFRLTELQAAVALEQLKKLPKLNAKRLAMVEYLSKELKQYDCLITPQPRPGRHATYYVYPLRYKSELLGGTSRKEFVAALAAQGVPFAAGYVKPLYLLPVFQRKQAWKYGYPWNAPENNESSPIYEKGCCPVAERLHEKELLLQLFVCPPQTMRDMADIVVAVATVTKHYT